MYLSMFLKFGRISPLRNPFRPQLVWSYAQLSIQSHEPINIQDFIGIRALGKATHAVQGRRHILQSSTESVRRNKRFSCILSFVKIHLWLIDNLWYTLCFRIHNKTWQWSLHRLWPCAVRLILRHTSWIRISDSPSLLTWRDEGVKSLRKHCSSFLRGSNRTAMPRLRNRRTSSMWPRSRAWVSCKFSIEVFEITVVGNDNWPSFKT